MTSASKAEIVDIILTRHPDGNGGLGRLAVFILKQSNGLKKYIVGVHANGERFGADEIRKLCTDTSASRQPMAMSAGADPTSNIAVGGTPPLEPEPEGIAPGSLDDLGASLIGSFRMSDSLS